MTATYPRSFAFAYIAVAGIGIFPLSLARHEHLAPSGTPQIVLFRYSDVVVSKAHARKTTFVDLARSCPCGLFVFGFRAFEMYLVLCLLLFCDLYVRFWYLYFCARVSVFTCVSERPPKGLFIHWSICHTYALPQIMSPKKMEKLTEHVSLEVLVGTSPEHKLVLPGHSGTHLMQ